MFAGDIVNVTEHRAALHTALRAQSPDAPFHEQVQAEKAKMAAFADKVRDGSWTGYTGKRIRHVVNIGIGGSDLGPKMVVHALHHLASKELDTHFVSNVDGADLYNVLQQIDAEETLAIVVSKTFTTLETMTNAHSMRDWFLSNGCPEDQLSKHFVGVSANPAEVVKFGIAKENVFEMWDWVGGRYSLWSAVGLSIMLSVGPKNFDALLEGADAMDQHFRTAPLDKNLPVLIGMIGIWYRNFFGSQSDLVAPYSEALHYLPSYLQQLEMESNGKSARLDGTMVDYPTAAVIWGEPGTNGQHAFFQMLHQGPTIIPIDFIAVLTPEHPLVDHHAKLLAELLRAERSADARPHARRSEEGRGPGQGRTRDASELPRQPADHDDPARRAHAAIARRADRALRAQGAGAGNGVGHQFVRPVGRRTGQDSRQGRRSRYHRGKRRSGEARFVDVGVDRACAQGVEALKRRVTLPLEMSPRRSALRAFF